MKCPNCNAEVGEGKKFCTKCGARLPQSEQSFRQEENTNHHRLEVEEEESTRKSGHKSIILILSVVIGLILAGGVGFGAVRYLQKVQQERRHEQLLAMIEGSVSAESWVKSTKKILEAYPLMEEERQNIEDYMLDMENLEEEDYLAQIELVEEMKAFTETVETRLKTEAEAKLTELKALDPGYASAAQKEQLAAYAVEMEQLIQNKSYEEVQNLVPEWTSYAEQAAMKKTGYSINVMQYDFNEFPKIRMYLDVRDEEGKVVKELSPNMFYISERDAGNGDFLARTVEKAVIMNENERLNINMLADTSGSMMGGSLVSAKMIMKNFLNTVQFHVGDQVKLTQFNSFVDKSTFFTGDISSLYSLIDSYDAGGLTKLYDTIIYGVQDACGQDGARCVIAFTDGHDEGSYNGVNEVVDIVSRYHVPVFIVRIGSDLYGNYDSELRRIAEASGGSFKNLQQFSTDMSEFYSQIYRKMKEYYVVEFEAESISDITKVKEYDVYIQNGEVGGETVMQAEPGNELFDSLLGAYLRSYILDMNNHHYNYLTQYVDSAVDENDTRSIQWQMKKQVSGGFNNVSMETLMDYYIRSIELVDENTIHIKTTEDYDVVYDEVYSDMLAGTKNIHHQQLEFMNTRNLGYTLLYPDTRISFWARVRQYPEYILKRGMDKKWRFSKYAGDLGLNAQRDFYDMEINR